MPGRKDSAEKQLASFIAKFTPEVGRLTEAILKKMREQYPMAQELVYDNYNALAIGFGPTEKTRQAIFSIAVFPRWVHLFFLQAKGIPDPEKRLEGSGTVSKHIQIDSVEMLDEPAVRTLMKEAVERAVVPFDPRTTRQLIIKSISPTQRPRRPATVKSGAAKPKKKAKK